MPERTTEVTLGEVMRAVERVETQQGDLRNEFVNRLDRMAATGVTMDRFADRNTIVQEKIEGLIRALEQEAATRQVDVAAEEAARVTADADERRERVAGDQAIIDRLDREKAERTTTARWLFGGVVAAIGTSVIDVLRGGLGA